jgi:hypothetical protein
MYVLSTQLRSIEKVKEARIEKTDQREVRNCPQFLPTLSDGVSLR